VTRAVLVLLCVTVAAGDARADFWGKRRGKAGEPEGKVDKPSAREAAVLAANRSLNAVRDAAYGEWQANSYQRVRRFSSRIEDLARQTIKLYEKAIALGDDAELRFRAITAAGYIDAPDGYEAVVKHVDGMRRADPMDPRELQVTWDVSIALSKLGLYGGAGADAHFERAIEEYEHWRHLVDDMTPGVGESMAISYTNAAELLMALGRLDEAIAYYRAGQEHNTGDALVFYGLAVAYDRDGQWENAKQAMVDAIQRDRSDTRLEEPGVFFVPDGDLHYYRALRAHVMGDEAEARASYRKFLDTCTGTKYAARAREHLQELSR
jgi:tetratricopeptide (TPR) repeat protein